MPCEHVLSGKIDKLPRIDIMAIRISNLVSSTHHLNARMAAYLGSLPSRTAFASDQPEFICIHEDISRQKLHVQQLCSRSGHTPADLPAPSYRAYQWLAFLSQKKWLLAHLAGLADFLLLLDEPAPSLSAKFTRKNLAIDIVNTSYLFRSQSKAGSFHLVIFEGFITAPLPIKRLILEAAFKKRNSKEIKKIRGYTQSEPYRQVISHLLENHLPNTRTTRGSVYDLQAFFSRINRKYFSSSLGQPRLVWSARRSHKRLGYYHPDTDTITINRALDNRDVPDYVVAFVLFHEMLHKHLGLISKNGRRYAHTRQFKLEEKRFEQYREAEDFIKSLNTRIH